ncbi:MAG: Ig-like domain-containing protein [Tepidisphaeraceae bacterium]
MRHGVMIEELESRDLFSSSVTTIGQTSGVTPAAASAGTLALGPSVVYFNAVRSSNTSGSSSGPNSSTYELRVYNTSTTSRLLIQPYAVKIEGADADLFSIDSTTYDNSTGISMAPGRQINITIKFTADDTPGTKTADIRFATSDPRHPVVKWPLRGLVTKGEGTTYEPSLQEVFNFFQLGGSAGINAGEVANSSNPYFVPSGTSDQVDIQTLVKADASKPVILRPLAEFTNHATPVVRMGFYTPGQLDSEKYLWYSPSQSSQSVAPLVYGQSSFDPGTAPFGLVTQYPYFTNTGTSVTTQNNLVRNVYSENDLNKTWDNSSLVHMKFYPYKDQNGNTVPNAYIVAEEEYSVDSVSDSQDLIFVVTNVKPSGLNQPTLSYENLTGYPTNDTMAFNIVQTPDPDVGNITRTSNTLRIRNSGTQPLIFSTGISGDFTIASGGGSNITVAPGGSKDIKVTFIASSGAGVHSGFLTLTTNDPTQPTVQINLHGNWQQYSEQTPDPTHVYQEPDADVIVNQLLGYQTAIPTKAQLKASNGTGALAGEVAAPYFITADTSAAVTVEELASWHNESYTASDGVTKLPTNSFLSWFTKGSTTYNTVLTDKANQGQSVLPISNTGTGPASGTFHPGTAAFGLAVENLDYTDWTLNANNIHTFRFFPARDEHGILIPNTYIVLHDYDRSFTNFDYQDEIYLVTNVIPVGQMKTPRTVYAQPRSDGNLINFTSTDDGPKVYGFNVYRQDTPAGAYTLLNGTPLARRPSGSWVDTTAVAGQTYYYSVTSVGNGGVESAPYTVKVN